MEARILTILEKFRTSPVGRVGPADFRARDEGLADPEIVLRDPNLTLYCLDMENRQAIFTETPPECDLRHAPFLYMAQYEHARRLVCIPYEALHRLAADVVMDSSRLILIYSVGRCGSTLVSRAYGQVTGVESLSEPDVLTQMLFAWRTGGLGGPEEAALLRSCTLLQCAPGRARGASAWALKFRSEVTQMAPLLHTLFPKARLVFLYRHPEPWARSFLRLMNVGDPAAPVPFGDGPRPYFGSVDARFDGQPAASTLELLASMWVTPMQTCLEMQARGITVFVARYEELSAAPQEVLGAMLAHCGLPTVAAGDLDAILERDSQAGSPLSRDSTGKAPVGLSPAHMDELRRLIRDYSPGLTADTLLPSTYLPGGNPSLLQPAAK